MKNLFIYNPESLNITKHTLPAILLIYDNKNYMIHNDIVYDYEILYTLC